MRAINFRPDRTWRFALAFLPFALLVLAYVIGSGVRLADNPNDKLLPSFSKMGEAIDAYALQPDARTGDYLLWEDTTASLTRLVTGLANIQRRLREVGAGAAGLEELRRRLVDFLDDADVLEFPLAAAAAGTATREGSGLNSAEAERNDVDLTFMPLLRRFTGAFGQFQEHINGHE